MRNVSMPALLLLGVLGALPVDLHAGDPSASPPVATQGPDLAAGRAAIASQDWKGAIESLGKAAARNPQNAGAQNPLGFAYRKSGNLDFAFEHYNEALHLDPKRRGANEYIGEAHLTKGGRAKAKEYLAAFDRICIFGCEEFRELKKAVAGYEGGRS